LFSSGKASGESTTATSLKSRAAAFTTGKTLLKLKKFRFLAVRLAGSGCEPQQ